MTRTAKASSLAARLLGPSRWLLGLAFCAVGVLHFVTPAFFVRIMPPYLPWHLELVYLSGFFEVLGGLGVLIPATRRLAGWGLLALLVAVFPANLHMALNHQAFADVASPLGLWLRLPVQPLLMLWVWSATRSRPA